MTEQVTKGADEKFCSTCGAIIKTVAEICPKCGVRQTATKSIGDSSEKSRTTTLLLCLFLGGFGAHRFYTGKIGTAILMLIFTFAPIITTIVNNRPTMIHFIIVVIWVIIDIILIISGSFKDKQGKKVLK